jgi:nicotinate-nucleotide adenylyltransferase
MNIALFGGSFDPPHIGHIEIVKKVLDTINNIDKLIIVPTYLNPFKTTMSFSPLQRYELISDIFRQNKKVEVSSYEIDQNKPVPTMQTVKFFRTKYKIDNFYLIIGADNLNMVHKWKDFDSLKKNVKFIVVTRKKYEAKNDIINFIKIEMDMDISSTQIRATKNIAHIPHQIQTKVKNIWNKE